ncbi:hypothetical protein ACFL20_00335, partial [Spirochaetota bacterium]
MTGGNKNIPKITKEELEGLHKDEHGVVSGKEEKDDFQKFEENPYDPEKKKPEDIVRLFYTYDVPIIPVVSKRNILIGILKKDDVISELSDIERVKKLKIDDFVTKLARKMTFDDLIQFGGIREFVVINIFGEPQGKWPRLKLFNESEAINNKKDNREVIEEQKDEQILEWIIYLVLEHIPRGLYAVNTKGKTIFFNSLFEEIYKKKLSSEVDPAFVEKSIKQAKKNEVFSQKNKKSEPYFYNKDMDFYYEKITMYNKKKKLGFLLFCTSDGPYSENMIIPGVDIRDMSLNEILVSVERQLIVEGIKNHDDLNALAKSLKLSRKTLLSRIKKYKI